MLLGLFVFGFYICSSTEGKNQALFFNTIIGEKLGFLWNHTEAQVCLFFGHVYQFKLTNDSRVASTVFVVCNLRNSLFASCVHLIRQGESSLSQDRVAKARTLKNIVDIGNCGEIGFIPIFLKHVHSKKTNNSSSLLLLTWSQI